MIIRGLALSVMLSLPSPGQAACGGPDAPCEIAGGRYYASVPAGAGSFPALIWLHGYAASGRATITSDGFVQAALARGHAVIAPDGQINTAVASKLDWNVADGFDLGRDDIAFLEAVRADAIERFGLDPGRILAAGYSRGGGMVWDLACARPGFAKAYAAHAGGFWAPLPERCAGGVHLLHSHGFTDTTLPPEGSGMTFYGQRFEVADVFAGLAMFRAAMGCPARATASTAEGDRWIKDWRDCASGSLRLELLPGGHDRRADWPDALLDWADTLPPPG